MYVLQCVAYSKLETWLAEYFTLSLFLYYAEKSGLDVENMKYVDATRSVTISDALLQRQKAKLKAIKKKRAVEKQADCKLTEMVGHFKTMSLMF